MANTVTKIDVLESTDYFFILKTLENLVNYTSESDIIKEVFELLNTLFSPRQIVFIDYSQDLKGKATYFNSMYDDNLQKDTCNSFFIEIVNNNIFLGVFEIIDVMYPEHIHEYRKIGIVVSSIFRVAISNARKFQIIETQKEQLQIYSNLLNEMVRSKDRFFSIIAHDLRGPLCSFMGLTTILADEISDISFKEIMKMTAKMKNAAIGLLGLLENLLEWARSQQGLIPIMSKELHLLPVIEESFNLLNEGVIKKNIKITYNIPLGLKVYADLKMVQTIIRNLVSNGLKFTPKEGEIVISANNTEDGFVYISVRDSGIGMDAQLRDSLFSADVKTNRSGTEGEPSSGLGLILCKDFVEKNGGWIWVESEEGKGSTFFFTLPTKKEIVPIEN